MKIKVRKTSIIFFLIVLVSFIARVFIGLINVETLVEKILIDDSFYAFSLSRNIAKGNFGVYNGVDRTNGFQPLWVLLISSIYLVINNPYLAINAILTFASLIEVFTLIILFKFVNSVFNEKTAILTIAFYGLNPFIIFQALSGLEVVLNVFFVVLTFYIYYLFSKKITFKRILILGLTLGLALLTRTDNLFLLLSVFLFVLWNKMENFKSAIQICFLIGLFASLVFSPFLLWSFLNFGRITLSSYTARYNMNHGIFPFFDLKPATSLYDNLKLIGENTYRGFGIILHQFGVINFDLFSPTALLPFFVAVFLLFSLNNLKKLGLPILYTIFIFSFYCFYFLGVQIRYFTPFMSVFFILLSLGLQNFCKRILRSENLLYFIFFLFLVIVLFNSVQQWNRGYFGWQREIYKDALWLRENTTNSDNIGCFSAGIPIYFSERRVINLDGVLNSEAAEAIANKSVIKYMKSKNITVWIDSVYFNQTVVDVYRKGLRFNVLENNIWQDALGEGKESLSLIEQREGIYRHLRGFEMLVVFFKAKLIY